MKTLSLIQRTSLTAAFAVLVALLLAGCATTKKVDWNSRLGTYTFDQAVAEYGPPDKQATLSDGQIVAQWITHRSGGVSFGVGVGSFGPGGGVGVGQSVSNGYSDRVMKLTFGPDGKLVHWSKNY